MLCRIGLALGLTPSEAEQMPARDYELLLRYWQQEPWGPWRDNLHAAVIAAEVRRPHLKKGKKVQLDDFMLRHPDDVAEEQEAKRRAATRNLFQLFKAVAKPKRVPHG